MNAIKTELMNFLEAEMKAVLERLRDKVLKATNSEDIEVNVETFVTKAMKAIETGVEPILEKMEKAPKKRTKKDKNAPKAPRNAYILFCADNRDDVKSENPEMKATEITKELARLWKEADEETKADYAEKAKEDKERHTEEMKSYVPSETDESPKKRAKKDKNAPKAPRNAYILFCGDNRDDVKSENPDMDAKQVVKELARLWKEADEETKADYAEKAKEDKERYTEEMKSYVPSESEDEASPKKGRKASTKAKKDKNAPKAPRNAYILFCGDNREDVKSENPDMDAKEITKELARLWKEADEETKADYAEKAKEDKERYEEEMKSYVPSSDEETSPKKSGRKASPKKEKEGPKRPLGSYMLFCQEKRSEAVEQNPEAKGTEITKILGTWWKALDEDEQKVYKDKAAKLLEEFKEKHGEDALKKTKSDDSEDEEKASKKDTKGSKDSKKSKEVKEVKKSESEDEEEEVEDKKSKKTSKTSSTKKSKKEESEDEEVEEKKSKKTSKTSEKKSKKEESEDEVEEKKSKKTSSSKK